MLLTLSLKNGMDILDMGSGVCKVIFEHYKYAYYGECLEPWIILFK